MRKLSKSILTFMIFGYAFLYIPIFFVIINSFSASEIPGIWTEFSLKWFKSVFKNDELLRAAMTSLEIAIISATASIVLGSLTAVTSSKSNKFFGKTFINSVTVIPIVVPEIIVGFSLLMLFMFSESLIGWPKERGVLTVVIGHIIASMAYVHVTIKAKLVNLDASIEEAAMNLGARPFIIFFYIKLPMITKSILTGWLLAFTLSLDDLVIASFLTGPGSTTLPIIVFSNVRIGVSPTINAFATIFVCTIASCLAIAYMTSKPKKTAVD